jgi:hypothetical protein
MMYLYFTENEEQMEIIRIAAGLYRTRITHHYLGEDHNETMTWKNAEEELNHLRRESYHCTVFLMKITRYRGENK